MPRRMLRLHIEVPEQYLGENSLGVASTWVRFNRPFIARLWSFVSGRLQNRFRRITADPTFPDDFRLRSRVPGMGRQRLCANDSPYSPSQAGPSWPDSPDTIRCRCDRRLSRNRESHRIGFRSGWSHWFDLDGSLCGSASRCGDRV